MNGRGFAAHVLAAVAFVAAAWGFVVGLEAIALATGGAALF